MDKKVAALKRRMQLLFVSDLLLEENLQQAYRQLLVAAVIVFNAIVLSVFFFLHVFVTQSPQNTLLSGTTLIWILLLLYRLYQTKEMGYIGHLLIVTVLVFFSFFYAINEARDCSLVWMFVIPLAVVAVIGRKAGFYYLIVFNLLVFLIAVNGLGQWETQALSDLSVFRLILAALLSLALASVVDYAYTDLNDRIVEQRKREKIYIDELKYLSNVDSLTNLYNRRYMLEACNLMIATHERSNHYLTFFILDIDHFKSYNDEFGHVAGDEALIKIAATIKNYVKRVDDLVFRLGGEEFAGIFVSEDVNHSEAWLSELTNEIKNLQIRQSKLTSEKYITISIGIFSARARDIESIDDLYRKADHALYQAKLQGRDRAVVYHGSHAESE